MPRECLKKKLLQEPTSSTMPQKAVLVLQTPFQAIGGAQQVGDIQNSAVWRCAAWKGDSTRRQSLQSGCHTNKQESHLLRAALITAGVQAEARQQIVGPDSPVILANDELFSDVKVSKSSVGMEKHSSNSKEKRKQGCWEEASTAALVRLDQAAAPRPRAPNRPHFPPAGDHSSWQQELLLLVGLATSSISKIPADDSEDFQVPYSASWNIYMFVPSK